MSSRALTLPALLVGSILAISPAPAQDGQPSTGARAWISPSEGATQTVIKLMAEGLPGGTDVLILAGQDPNDLRPIERGETDAQGGLALQLKVPEEAERGQPYHFAVDPDGEGGPVLAEPPFEVLVREQVAPGGA